MVETVVFVVAQDVLFRQRVARTLVEALGVRAIPMRGGTAALAWTRATRPALVVLRLRGDGTEGCALARDLRAQPETRHTGLVVLHDAALGEDAAGELAWAALVDGQAPLSHMVDAVRLGLAARARIAAGR